MVGVQKWLAQPPPHRHRGTQLFYSGHDLLGAGRAGGSYGGSLSGLLLHAQTLWGGYPQPLPPRHCRVVGFPGLGLASVSWQRVFPGLGAVGRRTLLDLAAGHRCRRGAETLALQSSAETCQASGCRLRTLNYYTRPPDLRIRVPSLLVADAP